MTFSPTLVRFSFPWVHRWKWSPRRGASCVQMASLSGAVGTTVSRLSAARWSRASIRSRETSERRSPRSDGA